jgi:hypothetical protein
MNRAMRYSVLVCKRHSRAIKRLPQKDMFWGTLVMTFFSVGVILEENGTSQYVWLSLLFIIIFAFALACCDAFYKVGSNVPWKRKRHS